MGAFSGKGAFRAWGTYLRKYSTCNLVSLNYYLREKKNPKPLLPTSLKLNKRLKSNKVLIKLKNSTHPVLN